MKRLGSNGKRRGNRSIGALAAFQVSEDYAVAGPTSPGKCPGRNVFFGDSSGIIAFARRALLEYRRCLILAMISSITGTMIRVRKVAKVKEPQAP